MKRIEIDNANLTLRQVIELASTGPVVITEKGAALVAIVGIDEDSLESFSLSNNPDFLAIIERSRESYRRNGGVPIEEIRRELEEAE